MQIHDRSPTQSEPKGTGCDCWPVSPSLHSFISTTLPRKTSNPNRMNTAPVLRGEPLSANTHLNAQGPAPSGKEGGYSIQSI
ncbi:uncharacterized protein K444DRAFT_722444 [Hyaloscypha bicolor E]|uniref:Uncharacterized protein n=1 Tax=Hyaloscypha bicolor E TaxID=1095630 RepID=A0A2J6T9W7_9HELO|nr:uncharacterized protein K444DRAFT_722444 [Hyaloscypha bicolor E]PMD59788.1 hypothetical protein K444DRAFT_722444 [Hyaloscypha bicolor E]